MNKSVYHETKWATYLDNGDGSLTVVRKGNALVERTVAYFKNTTQGQLAYRRFRSRMVNGVDVRVYKMYRCPKNGLTYDETTGTFEFGRRGNICKNDAKLFAVIRTRKRN